MSASIAKPDDAACHEARSRPDRSGCPAGGAEIRLKAFACAAVIWTSAAGAACPPPGETIASLQASKQAQWQPPANDDERQELALALLDCLSDPDPLLRDDIAYDALSTWMRSSKLSPATLQTVRVRLLAVLNTPADAAGFEQPFAALVISEVARVDRLHHNLSDGERAELVDVTTRWLADVRDYRAYDATEGWRHGVAHGADIMLQLALNERLQHPQAEAMLAAIAVQVVPRGAVAYQHGEPDRLAAPIYYLARRALFTEDDWMRWFNGLTQARQRTPINPPGQLGSKTDGLPKLVR